MSEKDNAGPSAIPPPLESQIHSTSRDDLLRVAADPALTEDLALAMLKRADLPPAVLEQLSKNGNVLKLRKVKMALVTHAHTPRHVSVPLARQFYTFDLLKVALSPTVPADVKVAVDKVLIARVKTITLGERLSLARRASGRVAGALLLDSEARVMRIALENPRLTEAFVIQAVLRPQASATLVQAVQHAKWSHRREVRCALLRTEYLSLARALEFSHGIPAPLLREVLKTSRLTAKIKDQLLRESQAAWAGCQERSDSGQQNIS
ncbi:MAG TPA: hypothetical protein VEK84_07245 [Terriglobales bacterium]|nr:hypothetical protein [Terriglobales bacterium]